MKCFSTLSYQLGLPSPPLGCPYVKSRKVLEPKPGSYRESVYASEQTVSTISNGNCLGMFDQTLVEVGWGVKHVGISGVFETHVKGHLMSGQVKV